MKCPITILAMLLSGLVGYGASRLWVASKEDDDRAIPTAATSLREQGRRTSPRPRAPRERSDSEAPHVKLLDHFQPGSADSLALLAELAKERFGVYGGSTTFHTEKLLRMMYTEDPGVALEFLDGIEDRKVAVRMVELMLFAPDRREIPRLKEWMEGQKEPVFRAEILRNMIWSWRSIDGPAALAAIDALPDAEGVDQSKLRALLVERIPVRSQLALVDDFPLPDRQAFYKAHGESLSRHVPEEIFAGIMDLPASPARDGAMSSVLRNWAQRDPSRALAAIKSLEGPTAEPQALREVAFGWSSVDSFQASRWVNDLPDGPNRDAASAGLAEELVNEQPDMAFRWAERISDVDLRLESLRHVMSTWQSADPEAARSALANSSLNEGDRRALSVSNKSANP